MHSDVASFRTSSDDTNSMETKFFRSAHIGYVKRQLQDLPSGVQGLYPSRPWLVYWCLQAADFLGITDQLYAQVPADSMADFLYACLKSNEEVNTASFYSRGVENKGKVKARKDIKNDGGKETHRREVTPIVGFAGGPLCQIQHLITSYAACCALCILGKPEYLFNLPRAAIKRWLISLRNDDCSFRVHDDGESDIRASYCAAVITTLLRLDDPATWISPPSREDLSDDEIYESEAAEIKIARDSRVLTPQCALFIAACQTHEGGFACGTLAAEAHGAYTQCGLAALLLVKQPHLIQRARLRRWLAVRQLSFEGGFNGRTNKLVDSCYSHWVGASFALLSASDSYAKLRNVSQRELARCMALPIDSSSGGGEQQADNLDEDYSFPCLRAKEVLLLDYTQLVDVKGISCSSEAAWDASEEEYQTQQTSLEQFLCIDDDALREGMKNRLWKKRIASNFRNASEQQPHSDADTIDPEIEPDEGDFLFHHGKLQEYVLQCCQDKSLGGLMDKPDCAHDAYHTCYGLSGLSISQNLQYLNHARSTSPYVIHAFQKGYIPGKMSCDKDGQALSCSAKQRSYGVVIGGKSTFDKAGVSLLRSGNPIFNMHQSRVSSVLGMWGMKSFI
ncbi:unnamed protein product [Phytomonas sp. EM1]|nr:unnamed protein product [Phytomonas sp. EM1]|eukprot:CCW65129.1 unnamed protein product [Phytomonas sp. isolate EM1]